MNFNAPSPARKGLKGSAYSGHARGRNLLPELPLMTNFAARRRIAPVPKLRLHSGKFRNLHSRLAGARMPIQFWRFVDSVTYHAGHLDRQQWIVLSFLVLAIGFVCMRGFGSRNNY